MNNQVLSIEQMQELIKSGVDVSKASMFWHPAFYRINGILDYDGYEDIPRIKLENNYDLANDIPTFTLQNILETLPKYLNVRDKIYFLTLMYDVSKGVVISYCTEHINDILHSEGSANQLNAAFNMLKWCKQNNYI